MLFKSIPGNHEQKALLVQSIANGKLAHAQLFHGPEGALNLSLAVAWATYLHCENRGAEDACGVCAACSKSLKFIHPDTHFVFPLANVEGDKDEERFKATILKQWRVFLGQHPYGTPDTWAALYGGEDKQALISREESREIIKALSLKPFESKYKVMIIWQPETMHSSAANGILKILEEPPPHTYFILVTNHAEQLLPTILSRTQAVSFPLLEDEDLDEQLVAVEPDTLKRKKLVQLAEGNLSAALELAKEEENQYSSRFATWMRACYRNNFQEILPMSEEFHEMDRMGQRNFIQYAMLMLREIMLARAGAPSLSRTNGEERVLAQNMSKVLPVPSLERTYHVLNDASYHLERNGSAKMIFMDASLQISTLFGRGA